MAKGIHCTGGIEAQVVVAKKRGGGKEVSVTYRPKEMSPENGHWKASHFLAKRYPLRLTNRPVTACNPPFDRRVSRASPADYWRNLRSDEMSVRAPWLWQMSTMSGDA